LSTDTFTHLWHEHHQPILAYLLRRVEEPADAADLLADTFLVAHRRPHAVPHGDEARLWLYAVARKQLSNHRRGANRHVRLLGALSETLRTLPPEPAPSVEILAVRAAVRQLPDRDREVLMLTAWDGLTAPEVAVVLSITPDAVRTRLARARGRLRTLIATDQEPVACGP
jgi:RNA polymerase sigma factor (sigma-70 family)